MIKRYFTMPDAADESVFFFGARQTGKTTLLKQLFPKVRYYDLLKSEEFERLSRSPQLLCEELRDCQPGELVVIDEIQKLPLLLDEVHWLMVNCDLRFVLIGSSVRRLRRSGVNLLGGRAMMNNFYPLVSAEIEDFDLDRAVNNGMIPRHYLVADASRRLSAYVGLYPRASCAREARILRCFEYRPAERFCACQAFHSEAGLQRKAPRQKLLESGHRQHSLCRAEAQVGAGSQVLPV